MKGTPYWMAPEVIKQSGHGRQADIWSVACTVIEMATGKPPWSQYGSQVSAMFQIASSKGPPTIPENLSAECKDFLYLCFNRWAAGSRGVGGREASWGGVVHAVSGRWHKEEKEIEQRWHLRGSWAAIAAARPGPLAQPCQPPYQLALFLHRNYKERPSATQLLQHPFLAEVVCRTVAAPLNNIANMVQEPSIKVRGGLLCE